MIDTKSVSLSVYDSGVREERGLERRGEVGKRGGGERWGRGERGGKKQY